MMKDRPISVTTVSSALLWIGGLALAIIYAALGIRGTGVLGVITVAAGATLTVRGYVLEMLEICQDREQRAFDLGRRVGQEEEPPPSPRRVH